MPDDSQAKYTGVEGSAKALQKLTSFATNGHTSSPKKHLHTPSDKSESQSWLSYFISVSTIDKLEIRWNMGNYIIDRKTGKKHFEAMSTYVRIGMHLLYYGSYQEELLETKTVEDLLKSESEKMGKEYDSPESAAHIQPFIESFHLQDTLSQLKEPDPKKYKTFNNFFSREIREDARPIADPDNDLVASSPADCRLTAYPTIDLATKYWIKGHGFTVEKLLGDSELASQFDGGSIVIARLAPQDYHRWHAPVSGVVETVRNIPGTYYTVNPQAINESGTLDVFCENKRSVMLVKRKSTTSPVAIVAVGAMLVGSIKYVDGVEEEGASIRRGQCLGMFRYGGSTVIVLFRKKDIELDEDLVKNSTEQVCETLMEVGWSIGEKR